jgi:hypothetical protein
MSDNIKKFPISFSQKRKNTLGPLTVECQISGRCLKFHEKSSDLRGGEFISIDVMSMQIEDDKAPHKICSLIVTREDLLEALRHVSPT